MTQTRKSVPYRSRWRYVAAPLAVGMLILASSAAHVLYPAVFVVVILGAAGYGLWCLRDWPLDRVSDWLRRMSGERATRLFGRRVVSRSEAAAWLEEHPGEQDRARATALVAAGRIEEGLAALDALPDADLPANRFQRLRLKAIHEIDAGRQPELGELRTAIVAIEDPRERLYAEAGVVQVEMLLASYGDIPLGGARRSAWQLGPRISLPISRELTLLYWAFAGVVVGLLLYVYEFVVGGAR